MASHPGSAGVHFSKEDAEGHLLVESYGNSGFKLQGRRVKGALYVDGRGFWPIEADSLAGFVTADLDRITDGEMPELLLIGTGSSMTLLPKELRIRLEAVGINFDPMDTGAAARTYNVLLLEGRRVAALLLPVE